MIVDEERRATFYRKPSHINTGENFFFDSCAGLFTCSTRFGHRAENNRTGLSASLNIENRIPWAVRIPPYVYANVYTRAHKHTRYYTRLL